MSTESAIEAIIACQARLIAALDDQDAGAIQDASADFAAALEGLKNGTQHLSAAERERLDHALRQNQAARARVHFHAEWTRQKIDRLNALRGLPPANRYATLPNL